MIRLAFLGCGKIAKAHAKRLRAHKADVEVGFSSRDPQRAQAFARELDGAAHGTYEEAIASPDVDAVAIVTPPDSHLPLALAALAAGKHVVLEKPPVPRASDFTQIAEAAAAANKQVFVAENYQYKPLLRRIRQVLADGLIGEPLFAHVNAIKLQKSDAWRTDYGALYEGGIHWIDFMSSLGTVRGARGLHPSNGAKPERSMLVTFDYAEGFVGSLAYSWEVPSTAKGLRLSKIYGRAGSVTFETNGLWVFLHGKKTRFYVPGLRDLAGYNAMWADFVQAWKSGTEPAMTLARARRDLELVEEAYATAGVS
ncbi:MAG TPA: Gfo/Idh/MocA family oxidoreductase [Kofleriaceae bacterium]|nr:Gfo/Idh/MocA family oxidoreductase [Kofleriaceae bacterium]